MRGIVKIDPAGFIDDFTRQALWTARLVKKFEDKDMELRPAEGSMSTAEQIKQICASDNFLVSMLTHDEVEKGVFKREFDVSTVKAALGSIRQMIGEVTKAALQASPEFWEGIIQPFGPEWRVSRASIAYLMLDHEAHHRGQLTVYLRVAGKTPPMLFDPVDEKDIFEGI